MFGTIPKQKIYRKQKILYDERKSLPMRNEPEKQVRGNRKGSMLREGAAPERVQKCAQLSAAQWQAVMKQAKNG